MSSNESLISVAEQTEYSRYEPNASRNTHDPSEQLKKC